jgi:hypothetical protein
MECISSQISQKYISFLKNRGVNIIEYTGSGKGNGIMVYQSNSKRQNDKYAEAILEEVKKFKGKPFPYFIILGLQWTRENDKHSITLIIDKEKGECGLHIFDSNGSFFITDDEKNKTQLDHLYSILLVLKEKIAEYFECPTRIINDMRGIKNLNTVGTGNCEALSLWYITKYFLHPDQIKSILRIFEEQLYPKNKKFKASAYNRLKIIKKINQDIIKLGKVRPDTTNTFYDS